MSYDREQLHRQIAELLAPEFSGDIVLHCRNGRVEGIGVSVNLKVTRQVSWTFHESQAGAGVDAAGDGA